MQSSGSIHDGQEQMTNTLILQVFVGLNQTNQIRFSPSLKFQLKYATEEKIGRKRSRRATSIWQ